MAHPNQKPAILYVQEALFHLSFHDPDVPAPMITGTWNNQTQKGVAVFQKKNRLPETGKVDETTWNLLRDEYEASLQTHSPPAALPLFPQNTPNYCLCVGEQSFLAMSVQFMLRELGVMYDGYETQELTGIYDESTEVLVKDFQQKNLLPATGQIDKNTWNSLTAAYEICLHDYQQ